MQTFCCSNSHICSTKHSLYGTIKGKLRSHRNGFCGKWEGTDPAQQCLRTLTYTPTDRDVSFTLSATHSSQQPIHSHTVEVNELTLALVALGGQEVFKVFDLVRQLWVQIELCWKLRDPIPGRQNKGIKREINEKY